MAYRFNGSGDRVEFAITPFSGHTFGGATLALLLKRTTLATFDELVIFETSAGGDIMAIFATNTDTVTMYMKGSAAGPSIPSASLWYLIAVTYPSESSTARFHIHNGTSWSHSNGGSVGSLYSVLGTDRMTVGAKFSGSTAFAGDIACIGIKKGNSSDAAIETLSRTAFQPWRDFGFEWLIGFDSSLESAGILQDQGTVGTGDEVAITGTSLVSDPPSWTWVSAAPPVAAFTATPLTGVTPLSVAFTDTSTNTPTSWAWTFGDGGTSTSQNPSHSYTSSGVYTVSLVATNVSGSDTETKTAYVTAAETIVYAAGGGIEIY